MKAPTIIININIITVGPRLFAVFGAYARAQSALIVLIQIGRLSNTNSNHALSNFKKVQKCGIWRLIAV